MEVDIRSVEHNPLLDWTEFTVRISHGGEATPAKDDVAERVSAEQDFDTENVSVRTVKTGFGSNESEAVLRVTGELDLERYEDLMEEEVEETESSGEEAGSSDQDAGDESSGDVDYEDIVSGTISDAKERLDELGDPDFDAALEAEKEDKNRTTFIDWLESQ